jgi:hypothetical protein
METGEGERKEENADRDESGEREERERAQPAMRSEGI